MPRTRKPKRQAGVRHINGRVYVLADEPVKVASPVKKLKVNTFKRDVIDGRVPCAMGPGGAPVPGCERRFAPNGSGAANHFWHGKRAK